MKNSILEAVDRIVIIVDYRHIQIDQLVEDVMQQIRRAAFAMIGAGADILFYFLDTQKALNMERDDVIRPEIYIKLFRYEVRRVSFAGFDTVDDEVEILVKSLDLWLVACFQAIVNRNAVKAEIFKHYLF